MINNTEIEMKTEAHQTKIGTDTILELIIKEGMLTTVSPSVTHKNRACGFQHMSHSMPEYNMPGNSHLTNHKFQGTHKRRHKHNTTPFRSSHTDYDQ